MVKRVNNPLFSATFFLLLYYIPFSCMMHPLKTPNFFYFSLNSKSYQPYSANKFVLIIFLGCFLDTDYPDFLWMIFRFENFQTRRKKGSHIRKIDQWEFMDHYGMLMIGLHKEEGWKLIGAIPLLLLLFSHLILMHVNYHQMK